MLRLIPPIAVPFSVSEILQGALRPVPDRHESFAARLMRQFGSPRVDLYGSGQSGLSHLLRHWGRGARKEVLVPAYTCWTVPAAVVRAGLRVRLFDIDPLNLAPIPAALERTPTGRLAAIIVAHLFARSHNIQDTVEAIRRVDPAIRCVEDAAQAWPVPPLSGADAILLSFGRGKVLPLGGGGAVLHGEDEIPVPVGPSAGHGFRLATLLATVSGSRPGIFRLPSSIPRLGIGATVYDPDFDDRSPFARWQERLGSRLIDRLGSIFEERSRNAQRLLGLLEDSPGFSFPTVGRGSGPLRLPVLASCRRKRDALVHAMVRSGVSASTMYPGTLLDIPALRPHLTNPDEGFPGARSLADRLFTLPVYPGLRPEDLDSIAASFRSAIAETL